MIVPVRSTGRQNQSGQIQPEPSSSFSVGLRMQWATMNPPETQSHRDMNRAAQPSRYAAERHLLDLRDSLDAMREGPVPRLDSLAWPAGLDRSILNDLALEVRTLNCLQREQLMGGDNPLTVQQLLSVPNFGRKSLGDLLFKVEDFLHECVRNGSTRSPQAREETGTVATPPQETPTPWDRAGQLLSPLLATAAELHGVKTLADALNPQVRRLASRMGIASVISGVNIGDVTNDTPGLAAATARRLALTLEQSSETERTIVEHRLLRTRRITLEKVGTQVGVTRERIRQVQARIERRIHNVLGRGLRVIASALKEQLGHMVEEAEVERRINTLLPDDQGLANLLFRQALIDEMGFALDNGVYTDKRAREILEELGTDARRLADDVGLVDEEQLMATLPDEDWHRFWPWLRERIGFHDLSGRLGLRDTAKARAKAALLSIGRPATRDEIGSVCGVEEGRVGAHLSHVPSVVRADKERWGLREWIDDEYDGIVGEIVQRIEEDGGATTTERLLRELPSKFEVSPNSVRAYMQTSKFVIRDGYISLASTSSVQLRDLDDVIDGRDQTGAPYWTFAVDARFFDGYSVTGVPPEFAKALRCAPDAVERVQIENLPDCRDLSISWRLASTTGASLGYLAEPLKLLGLERGQRARVTIKAPRLVELSLDDGNGDEGQTSEADAILERMMQRRRVF